MNMQKSVAVIGTLVSALLLASAAQAAMKGKLDAKAEFKEHCASCHADGGNIVNPAKTLKKASLQKSGIKTIQDIVAVMRKPGPGMTAFSKKEIPDKEAQAIAKYVLTTFK
jgi:cytochrome c6